MNIQKAVVYARVSSQAQAEEDKTSLDEQLKSCLDLCASNQWQVIGTFTDVCSGSESGLDERLGYMEMVDVIKEKHADNLVCLSSDRFARGIESNVFLKRALDGTGVKIVYVQGGVEGESGEEKLVSQILSVIHGYEAWLIKMRMIRGRKGAARKGQIRFGGLAPFGYENIKGQYHVIKEQADTVKMIFKAYQDGHSLNEVTQMLTDKSRPTFNDYKNGTLTPWNRRSVQDILNRTEYKGVKTYKPESDKDEVFEIPVPAIVTPDIWNKAQARLDYNREVYRKQPEVYNPFRGRIRCDKCGGSMVLTRRKKTTKKGQKVYEYFKCSTANKKGGECDASSMSAQLVKNTVVAKVIEFANSPDAMYEKVARYAEDKTKRNAPLLKQVNALQAQIDELNRQRKNAVVAMTKVQSDDKTIETLGEVTGQLDAQIQSLYDDKRKVEFELSAIPELDPAQFKKYWTEYLKFVGSLAEKQGWSDEVYESFAPAPQRLIGQLFKELDVHVKVGKDKDSEPYAVMTTTIDPSKASGGGNSGSLNGPENFLPVVGSELSPPRVPNWGTIGGKRKSD